MHTLAGPLQIAMQNGARRALVPLENKHNFLEVSGDIVERVDPALIYMHGDGTRWNRSSPWTTGRASSGSWW